MTTGWRDSSISGAATKLEGVNKAERLGLRGSGMNDEEDYVRISDCTESESRKIGLILLYKGGRQKAVLNENRGKGEAQTTQLIKFWASR